MGNDLDGPKFPLRVIFDDGDHETIESTDDLIDKFLSIDSTDPGNGIWVRDNDDRSVLLRVSQGDVEVFELTPPLPPPVAQP